MRLTLKLVLAHYRHHWIRTLLALAAVITSVAMVVVIIGGQTATMARMEASAVKPLGNFQVILTAGSVGDVTGERKRNGANPPLPPFDPALVAWVAQHPDVREVMEVDAMTVETSERLSRGRGGARAGTQPAPGPGPMAATAPATAAAPRGAGRGGFPTLTPGFTAPSSVLVLGTSGSAAVRPLAGGAWLSEEEPTGVVLDGDIARQMNKNVGDFLLLTTVTGKQRVKVAGILETPIAMRGLSAIYAGPELFARFSGQGFAPNRLYVSLKDAAQEDVFTGQVTQQLGLMRQEAQVDRVDLMVDDLAKSAIPRQSGVWFFPLLRDASVKLAVVAAMFIIFNTFSMGVQERTRQLAMLRAIGMTRGGVITTLLSESMLLAVAGWIGGMVIGWAVLRNSLGNPTRSGIQVQLDLDIARLLLLGAVTAFGAVLIATALPALLAARKRPLDGMSAAPVLQAGSAPWWMTVVGLILIVLNPLAAFTNVFPDPLRTNVIVPLSFGAALAGFVMLTPLLLTLTEPLFVQIAARCLVLNPRLLQRHLSANMWRTVGCVSALMVGLGLYMVVHIWGESMAVPFLMTRCPDAVIIASPQGIPAERAGALAKIPGVTSALPMLLEHPVLADLPDYVPITGIDFFSKDMLYLGCDLHTLLDQEKGMFEGIFVRGNQADADKLLAGGKACLITDNLWRRVPEKYDVGKTVTLTTEDFPHQALTYTIAGVVQMDGWHQFSQRTRMRRNAGRVGGMIMVPTATARAAYADDTFRTLWFKLEPDVKPAALEASIIPLVDPTAVVSTAPFGRVRSNTPLYFQTIDTRLLAGAQRATIQRMIDTIAYYPLWALALASVAVVNTLFASIRARSWEIGILRSIGQTRGQVVRQVLAEGVLIGLLACAVSVLFALLASKAGIIAGTRTMDVAAPYVIAWKSMGIGMGVAMVICILASITPAFIAAWREPLRLLQQGRSMD